MTERAWSNRSVLALAGNDDPLAVITEKARDVVFAAREEGWSGPPYDPFDLASRLGVEITPAGELVDARLVHVEGTPRIEFNPTRPRARVRFSVAHELAHLLFPDAGDQVRYRDERAHPGPDDWQLELLCNVAAAEYLMPVGALQVAEEALDINHLLALRRVLEVSTEALLLRLVHLTAQPMAVFAAARAAPEESSYRIDYVKSARGWDAPLQRRSVLHGSPVAECTAVGHTARGELDQGSLHVECVGVPPYPGQRYPRVVGFVRPVDTATRQVAGVEYLHGDATEPRGDGPRVIAHVVNDSARRWGGRGFARALTERWPQAHEDYQRWAADGISLGDNHVFDVSDSLSVFSMVAQRGYGQERRLRLRYSSLETCLQELAANAGEKGATVHMPLIGTGQAGGDWATIYELILDTIAAAGAHTTVYLLPGAALPGHAQAELAVG